MTARAAQPKAHANGAALTPAVLEDAVAQLLTQAVQPQLQAGILAGLTG